MSLDVRLRVVVRLVAWPLEARAFVARALCRVSLDVRLFIARGLEPGPLKAWTLKAGPSAFVCHLSSSFVVRWLRDCALNRHSLDRALITNLPYSSFIPQVAVRCSRPWRDWVGGSVTQCGRSRRSGETPISAGSS